MNHTIEYDTGSTVACSDCVCGELTRVVVDPVTVAITHLVVEPKHRHGAGHRVPVALASSTHDEIQLRCTADKFRALDDAKRIQLRASDHHVTHVLLEEGAPVGARSCSQSNQRRKQMGYEVKVNLTKDEMRDLPQVDLAEPI